MSTALLYHGFGLRGYMQVKMEFKEKRLVIVVKANQEDLRCPVCGSRRVVRRGTYRRRFRSVPVGAHPVRIEIDVPRVECQDCGAVRQVRVPFADERRSYTKMFERYVLDLSRHMTIRDVAGHLQVSWDMVKEIQKRSLEKRFKKVRLCELTHLAIDEICIGRGHRYLTVVLDLRSGAIVFVGDGKGADALNPFWKRLKASHAKIEAVAMDMSPAYIQAVTQHLPKADIVFDHFHIVKLFNEKLSDLRRDLYREAKDLLHKHVLKGTRWLLLKNPENLDVGANEVARLQEALRLNQPLATAYYMKEDLRQIWEQYGKEGARAILDDWIRRAEASGIRMLKKFAHTLAAHRNGILAFYDHGAISTGPLEGTNTKIRVLQRQAYGFRDMEFFKLKIYALHESQLRLVG
jgi:transposase